MPLLRLSKLFFLLISCLCLVLTLLLAPTSTVDASQSVATANQGPTAEQQSPIRAIALVIDGSGSINDGDFAIQKEGIQLSFQDEKILPRNGTVAVTVIQYAETDARIEVPYRLIEDNTDVQEVVAQVGAITQIDGRTNPGDGINRASSVLNSSGDAQDYHVICLSTDGLPNMGLDVQQALANARNAPATLDKFSVIAIEDPPNYYADDFRDFYNSLVFGGGSVTVVENSVAFANTVGGCLTTGVQLMGLEVNQAIQDWNNSVVLVEGKRTYVRAHLQPVGQTPTPVFAELYGTRNGQALPDSPLAALNPNLVAQPNAASDARRSQFDGSLNFRLPSSWLEGSIELRLEGVGSGIECKESAGTPNDCKVQVSFQPTDRLEVQFVNIRWTADGQTHELLPGDLAALAERLRAIYPIDSGTAGLDWNTSDMNWDGKPYDKILWLMNLELSLQRTLDLCFPPLCDRIYYGAIVMTDSVFGLADGIPGTVASGTYSGKPNDLDVGRYVHAHEIGHVLNQHHAVHSPVLSDKPILTIDDYKEGWCGETGDDGAPDFPYSDLQSGQTVATIGPMDQGQNSLIYGLDTSLLSSSDSSQRSQVVLSPLEHYELMSYCVFINNRYHWISDVTYEGIRNRVNEVFSPATLQVNTASDQAFTEYLVVAGLINIEANTAEIRPLQVISSSVAPPLPAPGEYALQLLDTSGNVVSDIPFEPATVREGEPLQATFVIATPADPTIRSVRVVQGATVLGSIEATSNVPTVDIVYPNGGENFSEGSFTIRWDAQDLDGDLLTYAIQYSPDAGSTWQTLAVSWPHQEYDVKVSSLEESMQGLIRIKVSDGFNTSSDTSDGTFTLPNHAPDVHIILPTDNQQFVGVQSVFLEGTVQDLEDGMLSGASLVWSSDLDGQLGTGEVLTLDATALSEGRHQITFTATDSKGVATSASVFILISRVGDTPIPPDLVVQQVVATEQNIQIVIKNQGTGPVPAAQGFWVDLYIDPTTPPTQPNQIWNFLSTEGLVWGVDGDVLPMEPGEVITLTLGDALYWPDLSKFSGSLPVGTPIYVQVDSANTDSTYGGILEIHESIGGSYNNVAGPVPAVAATAHAKIFLPLIDSQDQTSVANLVEDTPHHTLPSRTQSEMEN